LFVLDVGANLLNHRTKLQVQQLKLFQSGVNDRENIISISLAFAFALETE
jgi:hypothetical protein